MAPTRRTQLQVIARELSDRLPAWDAVVTDITSSDYFYESRNGLAVIRLEISPALRDVIDRDAGLFAHEHTVMVLTERDSHEALMWDKGGYDDADMLGKFGITHYLCNPARADEILDAVRAHPIVSDEDRFRLEQDARARV